MIRIPMISERAPLPARMVGFPDSRREAACLGEETVQAVLRSWADRREGGGVVMKFLRLQMAVHHPLGAVTEEEGALWGDRWGLKEAVDLMSLICFWKMLEQTRQEK